MQFVLRADLPIKYTLGVHQFTPVYPTIQDFMFDVISYLIKTAEKKNNTLDENQLKFSVKTLNYIFGETIKSEEFIDRIKIILRTLIDSEALEKKGDFIFIDKNEVSKYYKSI